MQRARCRHADLVSAEIVRRLIDDFYAVGEQEIEGRDGIVGVGTGDFVIVVAVGRRAVGLDHRPIDQIPEQPVG